MPPWAAGRYVFSSIVVSLNVSAETIVASKVMRVYVSTQPAGAKFITLCPLPLAIVPEDLLVYVMLSVDVSKLYVTAG